MAILVPRRPHFILPIVYMWIGIKRYVGGSSFTYGQKTFISLTNVNVYVWTGPTFLKKLLRCFEWAGRKRIFGFKIKHVFSSIELVLALKRICHKCSLF